MVGPIRSRVERSLEPRIILMCSGGLRETILRVRRAARRDTKSSGLFKTAPVGDRLGLLFKTIQGSSSHGGGNACYEENHASNNATVWVGRNRVLAGANTTTFASCRSVP